MTNEQLEERIKNLKESIEEREKELEPYKNGGFTMLTEAEIDKA